MKEIKFRGYSTTTNECVYGCLVSNNEKSYIICDFDVDSMDGENFDWFATDWYEVDKETVGQYTGLKDINRVEIYEGDIVEFTYDNHVGGFYLEEQIKGVVEWQGIGYGLKVIKTKMHPNLPRQVDGLDVVYESYEPNEYYPLYQFKIECEDQFEILGNIYENKDLLGDNE